MATITDSIGRVLAGRYRVEAALGSGASAHVFCAWDVALRRRVAIKVLHPALSGDASFLRRFRAEAQAAASLTHPHVLTVYDWGQEESEPFLVLELCGGGSLRDLLDEGRRLTVAQALAVGAEAAEGLEYAHGRGFVHRDVKPANLLFDEDGRLRVADFGLARALAEAAWTEPMGATLGTARYAAPEQALGQPVDGRADVFALALVLYEAVTGVVPFTADTTVATLMARVGARLPGHDALGPLAPVLDAATAGDPEQRLDASSLAARLRVLGTDMPSPQPLPLAGPGGRPLPPPSPSPADLSGADDTRSTLSKAFAGAALVDPTELGAGPDLLTAATQTVGGAGQAGKPSAAGAAAAASVGAETAEKKRRSVPLRVLGILLAAMVAAGGAAYAITSSQLLVPSHRVPALGGQTQASASAALRPDHFALSVSGRRSSTTLAKGLVLSQVPAPGKSLKEGATVSVVLSSGPPPVAVPSLSSVTGDCTQATSVLAAVGLHVSCSHQSSTSVASGSVIGWNPQGQAPLGSTVNVVVSSGPPTETIPSLTGSTCQGATTTLQAVGLTATCTQAYSSTVPSGQVISWSPQSHAPEGSTVTVQISQGPQPVVVPAITGRTVAEAIDLLQSAGLVPGSDLGPLSGHVIASTPAPGASVPKGTTVTLYSQ